MTKTQTPTDEYLDFDGTRYSSSWSDIQSDLQVRFPAQITSATPTPTHLLVTCADGSRWVVRSKRGGKLTRRKARK